MSGVSQTETMTPKEELALRNLYSSWPSERLVRAAGHESDTYEPEAVAIMLQELERRGISEQKLIRAAAELEPSSPESSTHAKVTSAASDFIQRKVLGFLIIVSFFAGLILAELATRRFTDSDTYYQEHALPRLLGASLGFLLSYGLLRLAIEVILWTKSDEPPMDRNHRPKSMARDIVGIVCYMPIALFFISVIVAFMP